jgi:hypothetical protein
MHSTTYVDGSPAQLGSSSNRFMQLNDLISFIVALVAILVGLISLYTTAGSNKAFRSRRREENTRI